MPRCKDCDKFTNFSKRGVKVYKENDIVEWFCFRCLPPIKFNPKAKIDKVQYMGHLRKNIAQ